MEKQDGKKEKNCRKFGQKREVIIEKSLKDDPKEVV